MDGTTFLFKVDVPKWVTADAEFKIDRTKYGIKYGSGSFFDNLGDKAISNDFTMKIHIVAAQ